jgi:hypothetical protein
MYKVLINPVIQSKTRLISHAQTLHVTVWIVDQFVIDILWYVYF